MDERTERQPEGAWALSDLELVSSSTPVVSRPADPWAATGQPAQQPRQFAGRPVVPGINPLAIAALATGLTLLLWPFALALGIGSLLQIRRSRERGRRLALAGVVLGVVGLLASCLAAGLSAGHRNGAAPAPVPSVADTELPAPSGIFSWLPGDCFTERWSGGLAERTQTSCAEPHYGEVFATSTVAGGRYPGTIAAQSQAAENCELAERGYITDDWTRDSLAGSLPIRFVYPDSEAVWARSHAVLCFLTSADGSDSTGLHRFDTSVLTPDQQAVLEAVHLLDLQQGPLTVPVTDPAQAQVTAQQLVRVLSTTMTEIGDTDWSVTAADTAAALHSALQGDTAAWTAAAAATGDDRLTAYRDALRDHNPLAADGAARHAVGLIDHDTPGTRPDSAPDRAPGTADSSS
ncbi:DUF4190 domain-containing protein [Kitasatospora sp. NPDC006697]|uniref:DUF4190 domain-containing protein n=1 Tax=Kitasatospora sp. NPDC006697 TaxID=3364020 RepID=UPI0036742446